MRLFLELHAFDLLKPYINQEIKEMWYIVHECLVDVYLVNGAILIDN